uniref:DH domain-containing protein n=1 Tax=Wuchereria bancrofti TaxID=6293 RepID=A0AAF5RY08_WUCBA
MIMLTTTETFTLLAQVAERIDDMRRLSISRRDALQKMALREIRKLPVQRQIEVFRDNPQNAFICGKNVEYGGAICNNNGSSSSGGGGAAVGFDQPASLLNFAISELANTEQSYVRELQSIVDFYIRPFEAPENEHLIASHLRDRSDILFVSERVTHRNRLSQQHRPMRPQSWASISTDSIRSSDTTTDSSVVDGNGNNSNGIYCSSPSSGSSIFVPIISDEDPDNNITTTDQLQIRSYSCPENSLGSLSLSPSSSSTATKPTTTTVTIPSAGVLNIILPSSILAKSLRATAATPLNTIVESSSSTELFATI